MNDGISRVLVLMTIIPNWGPLLSVLLRLLRNLEYLFVLIQVSNYGSLPSNTFTQKYRWSASYHPSVFMDNFPPDQSSRISALPPWEWCTKCGRTEIYLGGVGKYQKSIKSILTALELDGSGGRLDAPERID